MSVDIIITTYRNTEKLKICLSSIIEHTKYVDYRVYLWCNSPNDEVKQVVYDSMFIDDIQFTDKIIPIFNDTNDGSFSSNNNQVADEGTGEYILLLNDDVEPLNDDWLYNMKSIMDQDSKIGAVGSLLFYPGKQTIQHCGVFFSKKTNSLPFHMFYKRPVSEVSSFISIPRYYQAITGACMLVRRDDFYAVGKLDESYYYAYEDIDLCLKLKELGKRCVYTPFAQLIHHEGISGSFKNHPKLQENIKVFREKWSGKYINDLEFYLSDPKFMIYKNSPGNV